MKRFRAMAFPAVLAAVSVLAGCGGSSTTSTVVVPASGVQYASINAPGTTSNALTGIRGVTGSSNVFISGGDFSNGSAKTGILYTGPLSGGGSWVTLNYPSAPGVTVTNSVLYGPDNFGSGGVSVVGNYTTAEAGTTAPIGMVYQGAASGGGTWTTISPPGSTGTIVHSNMNGFAVGNYTSPGTAQVATAFVYKISTGTYITIPTQPGVVTITAYGIWWNGGTSYTICGGLTSVTGGSQSYLLDWDSGTGAFSNLTTYNYRNVAQASTLIAHFEGITTDGSGGYNLASDLIPASTIVFDLGSPIDATFVHVARAPSGGFGTALYVPIVYPGSGVTSANTVWQNTIEGVSAAAAGSPLRGYAATIQP